MYMNLKYLAALAPILLLASIACRAQSLGNGDDDDIVMLKNEGDALPLPKEKVAIVGKTAPLWTGLKKALGKQAEPVEPADSGELVKYAAAVVIAAPGDSATILSVAARVKNVVVVATEPQKTDFSPWVYRVRGIFGLLRPQTDGGAKLAAIMQGKVNPSARLPFSITASLSAGQRPMFPFGFGRSYTSFAYSALKAAPAGGGRVRISFKLANTGSRDGSEVAQVYVMPADSFATATANDLKAFKKVSLRAGESTAVSIDINADAFPQKGKEYQILVGPYSDDLTLRAVVAP